MQSESELYSYVLRVVRRKQNEKSNRQLPDAVGSGTTVEPRMDQPDQLAKRITRRLRGGSRPVNAGVPQYDLNTRLPRGMLTRHLPTQLT